MDGPFDYLGAMGGLGPSYNDTVLQGQQIDQNRNVLAQQKLAGIAQQIALLRAQQKQRDVATAIANPSAQAFADLQAKYPEDREAFKSAWEARDADTQKTDLREVGEIYAALTNGFPTLAAQKLERRIAADKAAGQDTSDDEAVLEAIKTNPKRAAGMVGYTLSHIVDPKDFAATFKSVGEGVRADQLQPAAVQKATADASKATTEAQYAPQVIQSDLATEQSTREKNAADIQLATDRLKLDWAKYNLDVDTLETNTALKVQELTQNGQKVEGASLTELTSSVGSAQQNRALSERSKSLADEIEASGARGGLGSSWAEWIKGKTGNQDAVSALRSQYSRLVNSAAMKNLPPGSASNADVQFALKGFPKPTDPPEYLARFLRGMSEMQRIAGDADDRKANWISANGNIGTAKQDMDVGGVRVPKGTTFGEFDKNAVKVGKQGQPPARAYLNKYGMSQSFGQ